MKIRSLCLAGIAVLWLNIVLPFFTTLPVAPLGKLLVCTESGFKFVDAKSGLPGNIHKTPKCPFCLLSDALKTPYDGATPVASLQHPIRIVIGEVAANSVLLGKAHLPAHYASRAPPVIL